jgi:rRNA maturation protein Nop10
MSKKIKKCHHSMNEDTLTANCRFCGEYYKIRPRSKYSDNYVKGLQTKLRTLRAEYNLVNNNL